MVVHLWQKFCSDNLNSGPGAPVLHDARTGRRIGVQPFAADALQIHDRVGNGPGPPPGATSQIIGDIGAPHESPGGKMPRGWSYWFLVISFFMAGKSFCADASSKSKKQGQPG